MKIANIYDILHFFTLIKIKPKLDFGGEFSYACLGGREEFA